MASNSHSQERHVKLLKRQRGYLVRQLPEPQVLLDTQRFEACFSEFEKAEIFKQRLNSDKAEKFLDVMEHKEKAVYQQFMNVLHCVRPELAVKLEGIEREVSGGSSASSPSSNGSSPRHLGNGYHNHMEPGQEGGNGPAEDAGLFGLSAPGPGPNHHLKSLGYTGREFLSKTLNGRPPQRQIFHDFCNAMGVENKLIQASSRSGNPTAYLIQQLCSHPDATFDRLENALNQIGQGALYTELNIRIQNGHDMDPEDN